MNRPAKSRKRISPPGTIAEIQVRRVCECPPEIMECKSPAQVVQAWKTTVETAIWYDPECESLVVFALNAKLRPNAMQMLSRGTLNETTAHPRDVLRFAIMAGCYGIVIAHNHPSGDASPSSADYDFTLRLKEAAMTMQINLIDHIIIGQPTPNQSGYYSFKEAGYL